MSEVPLREHLEALIAAQASLFSQRLADSSKAIDAALAAAKEAVIKAENSTERRLELLNEFRGAMKDQTSTMLPRGEAYLMKDTLEQAIARVTSRQDRVEGRGKGLGDGWGYLVGAVGIAAALWSAFHP